MCVVVFFSIEIEVGLCCQLEKKCSRLRVQIQNGLGQDLYRDASVYDKAHFVIPFPQFLVHARLCGFNNDRCADGDNGPFSVRALMENNRLHIAE